MTDESNGASGGDGIARELEIDLYGCNDERCGRSRAGREAGRRNAQFAGWSIRYGGGCREIAVAVRAHGGEYGSICRERDRLVITEAGAQYGERRSSLRVIIIEPYRSIPHAERDADIRGRDRIRTDKREVSRTACTNRYKHA